MQRHPSIPPADAETDAGSYYVFIEEMLRRGAADVADNFLAANFVEHGATGDRHRDEFVARLTARRARFPEAVWTIELLAGVGGLVVCHTTMTTPEFAGHSLPMWETVVIRFVGGRIAECWRMCDERLLRAI